MKRKVKIAIITMVASMTLAGCGGKQENGKVSTSGSTSMEKVISTLGEAYEKENKDVTFTYDPTGSGAGIQAVLDGRSDIGLSSRALKNDEKSKGLEEKVLAYDGIGIIVNKENKISNLSLEDIQKIYMGKIKNWKELGGSDSDIVLIGREAGSGTRDGFESITKLNDKCKYNQELTSTGDVVTTVSNNPNAIGYASMASLKDSIKTVSVNDIMPTDKTVKDGSYSIQRPFMLITKKDAKLSDSAQGFYNFIISKKANDLISSAGVVPAN